MSSNPLTPEDLTATHHRLTGGNSDHRPQLVGCQVVCSCGKWRSKVCAGVYTANDARRDFEAHVNFTRPVNVDQEDFEAKRKAWGLTEEQMLEMAASVFRCVRCRREYLGSQCRFNPILPAEGILCECGAFRFMGPAPPPNCLACSRPLMVSLELSWRLECPKTKCRGELVRVKGGSSILDKGVRFFGGLFRSAR